MEPKSLEERVATLERHVFYLRISVLAVLAFAGGLFVFDRLLTESVVVTDEVVAQEVRIETPDGKQRAHLGMGLSNVAPSLTIYDAEGRILWATPVPTAGDAPPPADATGVSGRPTADAAHRPD